MRAMVGIEDVCRVVVVILAGLNVTVCSLLQGP